MLMFTSTAAAQDINKLIIMTEEYPPYNFKDSGRVCGTSTTLVLEILDRLDSILTRGDIRIIPWARAYNEALQNRDAVIYSITRNKEREDLFKWVCPVGCNTIGVVARKRDRVVIKNVADFEKYHIGVVREDVGHQLMRKMIPEKDLDIANSSESNLRKLQEGRIDLFIYDVEVADFVLDRLDLEANNYETVYVLDKAPLCIAFNKDADDALIKSFQTALDEILKEQPAKLCE